MSLTASDQPSSIGLIVKPYHLDQRLAGFEVGLPADVELSVELPAGDPWQRMAVLYEQVAAAITEHRAHLRWRCPGTTTVVTSGA